VAKIVTDSGDAYLKGLGNPEGPHALACELVGTHLARRFGLPTFDYAILMIDDELDEIPLLGGGFVESGAAFCTRDEPGHAWGGGGLELEVLENPADIVRLVVFDTWVRNRDRHHPDYSVRRPNRDNVFLSSRGTAGGKYRLLAIDHTHCISDNASLNRRVSNIDVVRDTNIYGLFPEFGPYFELDILKACVADLRAMTTAKMQEVVDLVPDDWQVDAEVRVAMVTFLTQRAQFVADTVVSRLQRADGTWAFL